MKYVLIECGAQSAINYGTDMKLRWFADNWDILLLVSIQYRLVIIYLLILFLILLLIITGAQAFSNAHFGRGTGPVLLDRLRCTGREQNLLNCSHSGRGVTASYCKHYYDAGVKCLGEFRFG